MASAYEIFLAFREELEQLDENYLRIQKVNEIFYGLPQIAQNKNIRTDLISQIITELRHILTDDSKTRNALRLIDNFEYEVVKNHQHSFKPLPFEEQINLFMLEGYFWGILGEVIKELDTSEQLWALIKRNITSEIRSIDDFEDKFPDMFEFISNWAYDYEMALGNAALEDPNYYYHRIKFCDEIFNIFPEEIQNDNRLQNFTRAKAESLWYLGKRAEAEQVYEDLIDQLPNEIWGYIGWSDHFWLDNDGEKDYKRAEDLLLRALAIPNIEEKEDVLFRLMDLYMEWGNPDKSKNIKKQLKSMGFEL